MSTPVLLADIGGTNARFALADPQAATPLLIDSVRQYAVADFPTLPDAARHYLTETGTELPRRAVLAAAGRIENDAVRITNSPWTIDGAQVAHALELERLRLVNDFSAQAMALPWLTDADLAPLGKRPEHAPRADRTLAVLGPGTGLGVGGILIRDGRHYVMETEGGHVGFAPANEEEIEILRRLAARFGRVSNERLICGQGLVNLYYALCEIAGRPPEPLQPSDISTRANADSDPLCRRTVEVFCAIFGAVAGDIALALGAWDGVYLAGGVVPRLLPWLQGTEFRRRFEDKGRLAETLTRVPTHAVLHPQAGLLGAAAMAAAEA